MPNPFDEVLSSKGRLVASAGDTEDTTTSSLTATAPPPSGTSRLLDAVQTATSGEAFLKSISGGRLDISGLPGYIRQPIDILGSPVSLALLAAAPFTGGATGLALAGGRLGAASAGARIAGLGTEMLAGGLVGGVAAQEVQRRLPEDAPTWLKVAAPLATGAVAGGGAQAFVSRRLPDALSSAARTAAPKEVPMGNYGLTESPLDLPFASPGKTKLQQVMDVVKGLTKRGVVTNELTSPIIAQIPKNQRALQDVKQTMVQEISYLRHELEKAGLLRKGVDEASGGVEPQLLVTTKPQAAPTLADLEGALMQAADSGDTAATTAARQALFAAQDAARKAPKRNLEAEVVALQDEFAKKLSGKLDDNAVEDLITKVKANPKVADEALTNIANAQRGRQAAEGAMADLGQSSVFDDALAATAGEAESLAKLPDNGMDVLQTKLLPLAKTTPEPATMFPAEKAWVAFSDVGDNLTDYDLDPRQLEIIKFSNKHTTDLHNLRAAVMGEKPTMARTVKDGGLFTTRGRPEEDGFDDIFAGGGRPRTLTATPGPERSRVYDSQHAGFLNGEHYPMPDEALAQYYDAVGNSVIGRHALNQLKELKDADGNPLIMNLAHSFPVKNELGEVVLGPNGRPVMTNYTAPVPRGYSSIESAPGMAAESAVARQINQQFNPTGPLAQANKLAEAFNKPFRTLHVAFDMGDFIARIGPTAAIMHPVVFAKAASQGFAGVFNRSIVGKEFNSINRELLESGVPYTVRDFAKYGARFNQTDFAPGAIGKAPILSHLGGVYGNALDIMRARMIQAELLNKAKSGVNVSDPSILRQITAGINVTTGASNGAPVKNATILLQFPNWLQSQFEFLAKATTQGGMDGAYARRALIGLVGLGTTAAIVGNKLSGNLENQKDFEAMFENGFPAFRVGDQRINIFGPYASLARGMYAAMNGDPEPLLRGRASPLIQMGWDLVTGTTFSGQAANFDDAGYWVKSALPYSISSLQERPNVGGVLSAMGVNARQDTPFQTLKRIAEEELGKPYADTTGQERERLRQANPELYDQMQLRTLEQAAGGDKKAQGTIESQKVNEELANEQRQLVALLESGQLNPKQFRESLNATVQAAAIEKQRIRKDYALDDKQSTPTPIAEAMDKYFDLFRQADMGVLNGGPAVGQINWDEYERRLNDLYGTLTPLQQKALEERAIPRDPSVQWYYTNRDLIRQSGYFDTADQAFDKFKKSVARVAPGAATLTELYQAQNQAVLNKDQTAYAVISGMLNQVNAYSEALKRRIRAKDPELVKALIQNGYLQQPKSFANLR